MNNEAALPLECPIPISEYPRVTMAHGGGGRLMNDLVEGMMKKAFSNPALLAGHDGAVLDVPDGRQAFTTDSHVVTPIFFPGGDIGTLSVYGTVNDLAMCGARALWLSAGFIIEEGFPMEDLWKVVSSMAKAARKTGVEIVTGDTKVVDRGKGDGIYVNTAGIGVIREGVFVAPSMVRSGDAVVLSGDLGRHGVAIMAEREGIRFGTPVVSDLAPLGDVVLDLMNAGLEIHCMRDLTRGGLAGALNEIAGTADVTFSIEEELVKVTDAVAAACELLGFDPLYMPNEGRFVLVLPADEARKAVEVMRKHETCVYAGIIGRVSPREHVGVVMKSRIGSWRVVDMLSGEQLPRIC